MPARKRRKVNRYSLELKRMAVAAALSTWSLSCDGDVIANVRARVVESCHPRYRSGYTKQHPEAVRPEEVRTPCATQS
jgi:hypothetical protein